MGILPAVLEVLRTERDHVYHVKDCRLEVGSTSRGSFNARLANFAAGLTCWQNGEGEQEDW